MKRTLTYIACATLVALGSALPSHKISEDDPRWNCHTMGNLICGPTQP